MAVAYRGAATGGNGTTVLNASCTITVPAASQPGDCAVAVLTNSANQALSTPAGWTQVAEATYAALGTRSAVYRKIVATGDAGSQVTWTGGSGRFVGVLVVYSGVDQDNPVSAYVVGQGAAAGSQPVPAITTTTPGRVLAVWTARNQTGGPVTPLQPGTHTSRISAATNAGTSVQNVGARAAELTAYAQPGAYGPYSATYNPTATHLSWQIALSEPVPVYSGTLGLTGSGTLGLTGSQVVAGSASLSGEGVLTATAPPPSASGTLDLSGSGSLGLTPNPHASGSLALTGSGQLGLTPAPQAAGTLTLAGSGSLGLTPTAVAATGSALLSGEGVLTATGSATRTGTLALTGSGTLGLAPPAPIGGTANLTGEGVLSASGRVTGSGTLALTGAGALALIPQPSTVRAALALDGSGTLRLRSGLASTAALTLTGDGLLTLRASRLVTPDLALSIVGPFRRTVTQAGPSGAQARTDLTLTGLSVTGGRTAPTKHDGPAARLLATTGPRS